ncbi:MAG: hypothetical protein R2827_02020 [Bdellovibrionales bacterium]
MVLIFAMPLGCKRGWLARPCLESHEGAVLFAGDFNTKNTKKLDMTDQWMAQFGLRRVIFPEDSRKRN